MPKPINILSIDGGGIRGITPTWIQAEIEGRTVEAIAKTSDGDSVIAGR